MCMPQSSHDSFIVFANFAYKYDLVLSFNHYPTIWIPISNLNIRKKGAIITPLRENGMVFRYTTDGGSRETLEKGTIHGDAVFSGKFNFNVNYYTLNTLMHIA